VTPERVVRFPVRTVLTVIGLVLAVWAALRILSIAGQVITWILIALFFAMALNPAVEWFQRRGVKSRPAAVGATFVTTIAFFVALGATFVPTLIDQTNEFVDAVPGYVQDLTEGRGRLGFLQEKYHIVDRVKEAVAKGDAASKIFGLSGTAISVTKSVITIVVGVITIAFLTFFMLLEGPTWVDRLYSLIPERSQARWRQVGRDIYRTVGGYVTGNLFISLIAGVATTIALLALDVPFAVALGLLVAILDLIPLAGATLAAIIVSTVGFLHSVTAGVVLIVFFIVYQQIENHVLQPLIYGRTVQLSPLIVLVAVLIGASLAGVLGALGAIPVAGALQVLILDWRRERAQRLLAPSGPPAAGDG
jgi:predicted PurR-regulated permease PerM